MGGLELSTWRPSNHFESFFKKHLIYSKVFTMIVGDPGVNHLENLGKYCTIGKPWK